MTEHTPLAAALALAARGWRIARDELIVCWSAQKVEVAEGWTGARVEIMSTSTEGAAP